MFDEEFLPMVTGILTNCLAPDTQIRIEFVDFFPRRVNATQNTKYLQTYAFNPTRGRGGADSARPEEKLRKVY